ncbi:testis-expressed protein 2-like isoform X2 [Teleopsis dalmanni]|uniref:testis-expressed protein 2-like isoform X2 n=1 Tax=Teleopsis dalmanni TaxID=139649 RepID=UPI0018CD2086|nr:testis-expressed protein 2-like isoform X2 [Teleopsis dalmanni]
MFFDVPGDDEDCNSAILKNKKKTIKKNVTKINKKSKNVFARLMKFLKLLPVLSFLGLAALWFIPNYDFFRGMIATVFVFRVLVGLKGVVVFIINSYLKDLPEQGKFEIPDYANMTDIDPPAVEQTTNMKIYEGWMCEVFDYDPETFNTSLFKPVYVTLQGSILTLAGTFTKIPVREMWNEVIDYDKVQFVNHRTYNIIGSYVTLLPLDIPRRRYFSRKLPIKISINSCFPKIIHTDPLLPPINNSTNSLKYITSKFKFKKAKSDTSVTESSKPTIIDYEKYYPKSNSETNICTIISDETLYVLPDNSSSVKFDNRTNTNESFLTTVSDEELETLFLFGRTARQKEDWYRRFVAASAGHIYDQTLLLPNLTAASESDLKIVDGNIDIEDPTKKAKESLQTKSSNQTNDIHQDIQKVIEKPETNFQGLLFSSCAGRNKEDYIKFMALYQKSCQQNKIPLFKRIELNPIDMLQNRKLNRKSIDLWKGVDISLFLGPSGSVVWANVLLGRFIYGLLNDEKSLEKVRELIQKKLSALKLPVFIENITVTSVDLGNTPPLIHRISQPLLDERGIWVDADVTYEGSAHITISTELNLMRLKRLPHPPAFIETHEERLQPKTDGLSTGLSRSSILSSRFLDAGDPSSGESDVENGNNVNLHHKSKQSNTKIIKNNKSAISQETTATAQSGSQITTDPKEPLHKSRTAKFIEHFTNLSYIQRAMQNMSSTLTLKVDIKGLVGRATINMPPPPSDRIWLGFRGPPRLWISATPTYGDKLYDYNIVRKVIESKICEAINQYAVYPNLLDLSIAMLGRSSYQEEQI